MSAQAPADEASGALGVYLSQMDEQRAIPVTPDHMVRIAAEYLPLIDKPPGRDFVVHSIEQRQANGLPLMAAEIVIAGVQTRAQFPLAATYPLHFRKTYFPARLRGDPQLEFNYAQRASELTGIPAPIGVSHDTVRHCFIPGRPYARLTPFDTNSEDADLRRTRDLAMPTAVGLWTVLGRAFELMTKLHGGGLSHGDAQLQNYIVSPSPLAVMLIDFEAAAERDQLDDAQWQKRCTNDLQPLLHEAALLQATLGRQQGELAEQALKLIPQLFKDSARVMRYVEQLEEFA
jgi:hypothetical protein